MIRLKQILDSVEFYGIKTELDKESEEFWKMALHGYKWRFDHITLGHRSRVTEENKSSLIQAIVNRGEKVEFVIDAIGRYKKDSESYVIAFRVKDNEVFLLDEETGLRNGIKMKGINKTLHITVATTGNCFPVESNKIKSWIKIGDIRMKGEVKIWERIPR